MIFYLKSWFLILNAGWLVVLRLNVPVNNFSAIASWVINQYFRGVKCLAQGHNTAAVGFEPRTSRSGVRHSTTEPPRSPDIKCNWIKRDCLVAIMDLSFTMMKLSLTKWCLESDQFCNFWKWGLLRLNTRGAKRHCIIFIIVTLKPGKHYVLAILKCPYQYLDILGIIAKSLSET